MNYKTLFLSLGLTVVLTGCNNNPNNNLPEGGRQATLLETTTKLTKAYDTATNESFDGIDMNYTLNDFDLIGDFYSISYKNPVDEGSCVTSATYLKDSIKINDMKTKYSLAAVNPDKNDASKIKAALNLHDLSLKYDYEHIENEVSKIHIGNSFSTGAFDAYVNEAKLYLNTSDQLKTNLITLLETIVPNNEIVQLINSMPKKAFVDLTKIEIPEVPMMPMDKMMAVAPTFEIELPSSEEFEAMLLLMLNKIYDELSKIISFVVYDDGRFAVDFDLNKDKIVALLTLLEEQKVLPNEIVTLVKTTLTKIELNTLKMTVVFDKLGRLLSSNTNIDLKIKDYMLDEHNGIKNFELRLDTNCTNKYENIVVNLPNDLNTYQEFLTATV